MRKQGDAQLAAVLLDRKLPERTERCLMEEGRGGEERDIPKLSFKSNFPSNEKMI